MCYASKCSSTSAEPVLVYLAVRSVQATSDVLGVLRHLPEIVAETILKRFKYTQTPLQTAGEAGKALLESSQQCGPELVHNLPGDMPDMRALEVAAQSLKCQMEVCPVHGNTDEPVQ